MESKDKEREGPCTSTTPSVSSAVPEIKTVPKSPTVNSSESPRTVLRLKRRIDEDPAQVLLLSFKRSKGDEGWKGTESSKGDVVERVLKFAGTVTEEGNGETTLAETISHALALKEKEVSPPKDKPDVKSRSRTVKLSDKSRLDFQKNIVQNRFRIINTKRGIENLDDSTARNYDTLGENSVSEAIQKLYDMYDLVKEESVERITGTLETAPVARPVGSITCNGVPMLSESRDGESKSSRAELVPSTSRSLDRESDLAYVYDLYIANEVIGGSFQDQSVNLRDLQDLYGDELFVDDGTRGDGEYFDDEVGTRVDDDEDSNDEDNCRNEYPSDDPDEDEEDVDSDAEDMDVGAELSRMRSRFKGMKFEELSSDEDGDGALFGSSRYKNRGPRDSDLEDEVVSAESDSD